MSNNNTQTLIKYQEPARPALGARDEMEVADVVQQVQKILQIKQAVMQQDQHYGIIPGTPKPTLYKAGAEKLAMTFRMSPTFTVEVTALNGNGHREYSVVCTLTHIISQNVVAQGVGSCNTMESKYRYRKGEGEPVGPVPKTYWSEKNAEKKANIIGGRGFGVKKIENAWMVVKHSDKKVEHDNPSDFYNTCLKMAKKRAFVDAVITATGGSDLFTQDIEDFADDKIEQNWEKLNSEEYRESVKNQAKQTAPAKTKVRGGPIPQALEATWIDWDNAEENLPEEAQGEAQTNTAQDVPTSAEPQQASPGSPASDVENQLFEWRTKAGELDPKMGFKRFDGTLAAQLKARRVTHLNQLARDAQASVLGAMRMVVEGMRK